MVLLEPGRAGEAAIDVARELADDGHSTVTVVSVVPQAASGARCGNSALEYNGIVRDTVRRELEQAREQLREIGDRAACELLVDGADPPLPEFVAVAGFELILLPARRRPLRSSKHPVAAALSHTGAEVRIVDPRADPSSAMV